MEEMLRLSDYQSRAMTSVGASLVSAFAAAFLLRKAKGLCVSRYGDSDEGVSLVCAGPTFSDLGWVDYLIIVAVALIVMASVWSLVGKFGSRRNKTRGGSTDDSPAP